LFGRITEIFVGVAIVSRKRATIDRHGLHGRIRSAEQPAAKASHSCGIIGESAATYGHGIIFRAIHFNGRVWAGASFYQATAVRF